ncbi:AraC family transcriptional regulator [Pseudomonas monteilii]|uniref:AraC family transcriptional regulator n=1 Tax=Pseudomonas monteilii TaxID=76759 RepID=UPI001E53FA75|nr:AraC family transcriptional regulator [Pseudomonas monteilii]MCE1020679.1 AraC family transcriptional regulator [Pseudomonas monteilii]MCE1038208.1 AraC family transcriptional regulator [Pseudomonas monteilii]MCE1089773.1 AraC family transcriptional regulator [Pseudomonas monteilii]
MSVNTLRKPVHVEIHDLAEAQAWMSTICGPHMLRVDKPAHVRFRHQGRKLESLTIGHIEYGTEAVIDIRGDNALNSYSISLPDEGFQELHIAGSTVHSSPDSGLILGPTREQHLTIDEKCRKLQIAIPIDTVSSVLESIIKKPVSTPVEFMPLMSAAEGKTASWWRMIKNALVEMDSDEGLLGHPGVALSYSDFLVRCLLISQPNSYSYDIEKGLNQHLPSYVLKAKEFIEFNATNDICLEDIELVAAVPKYKLFDSFKKFVGTSPMAYLKQFRLLGVRRDILQSHDHRNIAEIATSWGFSHLGRFSADYRKAFSEAPSETLSKNGVRNRR